MATGEGFNRVLWIFRGSVALIAIGLLVLLIHRAGAHHVDSEWLELTAANGRTAQGADIAMRFDRPGHPLTLATQIRAPCASGMTWTARWSPFDGTAVPFRRDRRGLRVVEISDTTQQDGTFAQSVFSVRATLGPGARQVRGWVRLTASFSGVDGWATQCDSGRVPFAIDAPLAPTAATSARPS
jgi:hypothetical protein